jgi:hypothetical protein
MAACRSIVLGLALLTLAQRAPALEKRRGFVRLTESPVCTNQCDVYYLEPDSGYSFTYLKVAPGVNIILGRYVDTRVEVTGYRAGCGACLDLMITDLSSLPMTDVVDDPAASPGIASTFLLHQNYPNPFNPSTTIEYSLHLEARVDVNVFDMLGRHVATLVSAKQSAGDYRIEWNGSGLAGGIFYCRFMASGKGGSELVQTKPMILLR